MGFEAVGAAVIDAFGETGVIDAVGSAAADMAVTGGIEAGAAGFATAAGSDLAVAGGDLATLSETGGNYTTAAADSQAANAAKGLSPVTDMPDSMPNIAPGGTGNASGLDTITSSGPSASDALSASQLASGLGNLVTGAAGLTNASKIKDNGKDAQKAADPFGSQRGQYADMLSKLMADPSGQLGNLPGYKAGLDAVQRSMGSQGYTNSGNMAEGLLQYGGKIFNDQATMLGNLAGAQFNPAAGAQLSQQGQIASTNLQGQALGTIAQGATLLATGG